MSSIRSVFNFKVFWQNFRSAQGLLLVAMIIYQAGILINCFSLSRTPDGHAGRCVFRNFRDRQLSGLFSASHRNLRDAV